MGSANTPDATTRLPTELTRHGFAVYALDHRGHGRSAGGRANIDRFAHARVRFLCLRRPRSPSSIPTRRCTCSVTAWAVRSLLPRRCACSSHCSGLVLSAPALSAGEPPAALRVALARVLSTIAPGVGALKLDARLRKPRPQSRARVRRHDPLVFHGSIPARTVVELLDAMADFPRHAPHLRLPTARAARHGRQARAARAEPSHLPGVRLERSHAAHSTTACITKSSTSPNARR